MCMLVIKNYLETSILIIWIFLIKFQNAFSIIKIKISLVNYSRRVAV